MSMGWLSRLSGSKTQEISGNGIVLRHPRAEDFECWRELRQESQTFLSPWEPQWAEDELSSISYRLRLRAQRRAIDDGNAQPFFIFASDGETLLGGINITNIRRGVAQAGTLGYWIGAKHAGQGHMTAALATLQQHAALRLNLHRLEAACLPRNTPSLRLLERSGFDREGLAKSYLKINGIWEDHLLWGKSLYDE
jgi:[ribosomal protein S5]-alanine N-acetyltransferase